MKPAAPVLDHDWFPRPLPANVSLGSRSWCYSAFSCLHYESRRPAGITVGSDTGIYNGTFFDLGPDAEVVVGKFCTLVGAIICTNQRVSIGDYAFLAHEVVLADTFAAMPFRHPPPPPSAPGIQVGANAWIGARCTLLAGAVIGEGAIVGAGTVVNFVVPPLTVVAGNPARIVRTIMPGSKSAPPNNP